MIQNYTITDRIITKALRIDAPKMTRNINLYTKQNMVPYKLCVNTWVRLAYDVNGEDAALTLQHYIESYGLLDAIDTCSQMANTSIKSEFKEVISSPLRVLYCEDPKDTLQLLRYPKRFSPYCCELLNERALEKFLDINEKCKGEPSVIAFSKGWKRDSKGWSLKTGPVLVRDIEYPRWLIHDVRYFCHLILREPVLWDYSPRMSDWHVIGRHGGRMRAELSDDRRLMAYGSFSNGATADGCKTFGSKVLAFTRHSPYYKDFAYPLVLPTDEMSLTSYGPDLDYVKVVCVPKSYKTPRIIAEVSAYRQFFLQAIRKLATDESAKSVFGPFIILDDQGYNTLCAFAGSVHGVYATVDLSSASDSIADILAHKVLPKSYYEAVERWNPSTLQISLRGNKSTYPRYIFQTSGNGSTFVLESVIFLAIALAAWQYCKAFTSDADEPLLLPRVYGDDIICDVRTVDTLYDFLELLGFTVNRDKSFGSESRYRESCGAEYWCGYDVATQYYPRKQLKCDADGLSALVSLQHKFYRYPSVKRYLTDTCQEWAKELGAKLTYSEVGTFGANDLYAPVDLPVVQRAPLDLAKAKAAGITDFNQSYMLRDKHSTLVSTPQYDTLSPKVWDEQWINVEMVRYVDWLQKGPVYEDDLMEILKIPQRISTEELLVARKSIWKLR